MFAATRGALDVPGHGIVLHPDGADRRLTALAGLVSWPGSRLLAHRPEQRAVVRLTGDGDTYYATVVRPGLDADLRRRLADLRSGAPGPAGLGCPDLTDAQVVAGPDGGIGLFGLETVTVGELARGVASLLVGLELRVAQGELTPSRARTARTAVLAGLRPDEATLARVPAYERAARLRLAGEYTFQPRWRGLSRALLAAATP